MALERMGLGLTSPQPQVRQTQVFMGHKHVDMYRIRA